MIDDYFATQMGVLLTLLTSHLFTVVVRSYQSFNLFYIREIF